MGFTIVFQTKDFIRQYLYLRIPPSYDKSRLLYSYSTTGGIFLLVLYLKSSPVAMGRPFSFVQIEF